MTGSSQICPAAPAVNELHTLVALAHAVLFETGAGHHSRIGEVRWEQERGEETFDLCQPSKCLNIATQKYIFIIVMVRERWIDPQETLHHTLSIFKSKLSLPLKIFALHCSFRCVSSG